jgi:hypothetical protein
MALNYKGSRNGAQRNISDAILLYNSITVSVGDAIETYTNGYATVGGAAVPIKGIVHAITDKNGLPIKKGSVTAGTAQTPATTTVTTAADNTTALTYYVKVDTSRDSIYSAEVNGTIGTTVDSELIGTKIDIDSANTDYGRVLETTATRTVGTPANFYSFGTDPDDSTRLLVAIALSEEDSVYE